ncbi:hypothetical protein scyTo_0008303 [Scyliorhinus torazame]|uniref:Uncharacterized protein n=1 Tax=Scyliorhinus torazame TaxID=75743 RepID=A0A401P714_SCYTO|nr:hypothetical protein [Scyliorhinus torazame]
MDDRLNTLLERSVTLCGESGAHSKTFARSQQSGAWPSLGKGHRGGGDSSVPAEGDVYERMTTAQHYKSGRRDAVNSSRSLGPIYDLWRKLSNVRDTYNVINDPRKLLGAVGKARTFPGTGDAATRHPVTHGGSPNTMAQPYALIEAPVPERCVPEGHQAAADCGGYKVKEVEGSKSSSWSPGRQQADAELNRADWQLSLWRRGLKELAANDDNGLEARAFDSRKRDEDKKPNKKEEKLKMVAGQMYEFMEAFPTDKQSELEKGSGYEYMASCGQHKLLLEGEGAPGSSKVHRAQGAYLDIVGLKHKKEKGFPEDERGAFAYPLELISGSDRSRPAEGATYVNIPVSPTSKKQLHYMELDLQESSPAIRGASSSKYAQIDITATETAHKVGTQHAQNREERLQELEQKRKGAAPQ